MIIYGYRTSRKPLEQGMFQCPVCGSQAAYLRVKNSTWLTLYFIPVLPVYFSEKLVCGSCGGESAPGAAASPPPASGYGLPYQPNETAVPAAALAAPAAAFPAPAAALAAAPLAHPASNSPVLAARRTHPLAICSLITGLVGLIGFCTVILSLPFSFAAILTGHLAISKIGRRQVQWMGKGQALAGLLMGYTGLLFSLALLLFYFVTVYQTDPRRAAPPLALDQEAAREASPPSTSTPAQSTPAALSLGPDFGGSTPEMPPFADPMSGPRPPSPFGMPPGMPNGMPTHAGPNHRFDPYSGRPAVPLRPDGMRYDEPPLIARMPGMPTSPSIPNVPGAANVPTPLVGENKLEDAGPHRPLGDWTAGRYVILDSPFVGSTDRVLTGNQNSKWVDLYSLGEQQVVHTIKHQGGHQQVYAAALSPDGTRLYTGLSNGEIAGWSIDTAGTATLLPQQPEGFGRRPCKRLYYGRTADFLMSMDISGHIQWQATTRSAASRTAQRTVRDIHAVRLPSSGFIAQIASSQELWNLNLKTGDLEELQPRQRYAFAVDISPAGDVCARTTAGELTLTDLDTQGIVWNYRPTSSPKIPVACRFSNDGQQLAVVMGNRVELIDVETGKQTSGMTFSQSFSRAQLHFSPDDKRLSIYGGGSPVRHFVVGLNAD